MPGIKHLFVATPYALNISFPSGYYRINDVQHNNSHESRDILPMRDDEDYVDLRPLAAQIWNALKLILTGAIIITPRRMKQEKFFVDRPECCCRLDVIHG